METKQTTTTTVSSKKTKFKAAMEQEAPSSKKAAFLKTMKTQYTTSLSDLTVGQEHTIVALSQLEGKYGTQLKATLSNGACVFLPNRFDLTDDQVSGLNEGKYHLSFTYLGMKPSRNGQYHDLKFGGSLQLLAVLNRAETHKLEDLTEGQEYPIIKMVRVQTKFGESLKVVIKKTDEQSVSVFLPKRFNDRIKDSHIDQINDGEFEVSLMYNGSRKLANGNIRNDVELV